MAGSVKIKDRGYDAMMRRLRGAAPTLRVGVFGDAAAEKHADSELSNGEIAAVHEFGTEDERVPERAWLRGYVDENNSRVSQMLARVAEQVTAGKMTREQGLNLIGLQIVGEIKRRLPHLSPPLDDKTIKRKGSSATLIDKGQFRSAIAHSVTIGGT